MLKKIAVKEYMSSNPITFKPDTDVYQAIRKLLEHKITGAPVVDEQGNVLGSFSEMDCMRIALTSSYYEDMGGKVSEYMSTDIKFVDADTSIVDVAEMFINSKLRHFPVVEEDRLIGVISRVDVLQALLALY